MTIPHGTTTGYSHHKCRCDLCRKAVREYQQEYQQAKRAGTWEPKPRPQRVACSVDGCTALARYRNPDLCGGHYQQAHRGIPLAPLQRRRFVADGMKECTLCGEVKPVEEYNRRRKSTAPMCRECDHIIQRARRYGMSYTDMKAFMDQPCAGCLADLTGHMLHIDHCHTTGKVRGVLCHHCNTVLTKHMTPEVLRRLADYLDSASP